MKAALLTVAALSLSALWQQMTRPTNSDAAASRGVSAYEREQYAQATGEFSSAVSSDPSPQNVFNLGTAQIAAGERAAGSATLGEAMTDPSLRAKALYNRGNSALAANANDHAIRDYTAALKLAPADGDAKRNLEIALRRQQSQQRQNQQSGGQNQQPQAPSPQPDSTPQPSPRPGEEQQQGEADAEALLRSVQQQEQEELARMKRARGDSRRVGW